METTPSGDRYWPYEPFPSAAIRLYQMIWQLETWLRTLVYVELRADRSDWEEPIRRRVNNWPPVSLSSDKRLHHMATPHQQAVSYLTFGQLWDVISDDAIWPLFATYFPPKENAAPRIDEVKAIRNRVAHFRRPNPHDAERLALFLTDMERGVRCFCKRYVAPKYAVDDPVTQRMREQWNHIGYGTELYSCQSSWLYAPEPNTKRPILNAQLDVLTHNTYAKDSHRGVIYRLSIQAPVSSSLDRVRFLECVRLVHKDVIHVLLSNYENGISVTAPAVRGVDETVELIAKLLELGRGCVGFRGRRLTEDLREELPEYVLWPDHMLTFFDPEMRDPVLVHS